MPNMPASPYQMTVDLNVLDHLGINLYSNIAAVLTEAVANAWDADADACSIRIDKDNDLIEIEDDGIGMTIDDMNRKYLRVGYRRRENGGETGSVTEKERPVMGRKGLGKLSLFSIADEIEVQSFKDGEAHGLLMTTAGIQSSVENREQEYRPESLAPVDITISKGTLIRLRKIKRKRLGRGVAALRKRLSRRFSVMGEAHGFEVAIDGEPLSSADRGDLPKVQFMWSLGEDEPELDAATNLVEKESLPARLDEWENDEWVVKGWLGTSRFPKELDDDEAGNLNSIVVFARGRLFHENILDRFNDGRLYTKYLTGQIEADFLDVDGEPDIATSDRQRIQEDDPRYIALIAFLKQQMTALERRWSELRKKHEVEKAKEENPALTDWLGTLPEGFRTSAETMISRISALTLEAEDDRSLLYRHGIMAFERMRLRGSTEELAQGVGDIETLLALLAGRDSLEAALYRDIVSSRLDAIRDFAQLTDDNQKEVVLQRYLFEHLWLLDPTWERATGSERIEQTLKKEYADFAENLTEEESKGRLDIRYKTSAGKHIIVELKRAGRLMGVPELMEQGQKYKSGLSKCLEEAGHENPEIEIVFVLGRRVREAENPDLGGSKYVGDTLRTLNARVVYYDEMIHNAQEAYKEYLEHSNAVDSLQAIVDRL